MVRKRRLFFQRPKRKEVVVAEGRAVDRLLSKMACAVSRIEMRAVVVDGVGAIRMVAQGTDRNCNNIAHTTAVTIGPRIGDTMAGVARTIEVEEITATVVDAVVPDEDHLRRVITNDDAMNRDAIDMAAVEAVGASSNSSPAPLPLWKNV